ncbi:hypothetical protein EVAR_66363_1 [Eumeta japonica]|uniref:Uncharacterized protein n=1 Tax=Eumeta variegata TaxID=151549 RepID=A0A4C1ZM21_EUMVA|nr:hypothetical protein EVAR_66363_1 [Eumeta japonica]
MARSHIHFLGLCSSSRGVNAERSSTITSSTASDVHGRISGLGMLRISSFAFSDGEESHLSNSPKNFLANTASDQISRSVLANSHPNPLLVSAVSYEPPPSHHFCRRPRNVLIDPPNDLTVEVEKLIEVNKMAIE